jgi:hypothetical protein
MIRCLQSLDYFVSYSRSVSCDSGGSELGQADSSGRASKTTLNAGGKRRLVSEAIRTFELSERRACSALKVALSTRRYRSRRADRSALRLRLRELALARPRFSYVRLWILLRRVARRSTSAPIGARRSATATATEDSRRTCARFRWRSPSSARAPTSQFSRAASPRRERDLAAGFSDHVWSLEELIGLLGRNGSRRKAV